MVALLLRQRPCTPGTCRAFAMVRKKMRPRSENHLEKKRFRLADILHCNCIDKNYFSRRNSIVDVQMNPVAGQEYNQDKSQQIEELVRNTPARGDQARSNDQSPERPETNRVTQAENRMLDTYA